MTTPDRHLDLGCGEQPRNPYQRPELHGVDVRERAASGSHEHRVANLVLEPIPYADDHFSSVSAFDFIEHVPRLFPDGRGGTMFPFIRLMDEVWRVLAPGGRFYALTPAYPHPEAFVDPTHVNIITERSHLYFCGDDPLARMYGFSGRFEPLRVARVEWRDAVSAPHDAALEHRPWKRYTRSLRRWLRWLRWLRGKQPDPFPAYVLWELQAIKPAART